MNKNKTLKTIIVDDSSLIRDRLKEVLLEFDNVFITGEADSLAIAQGLIQKQKPDMVLLDIRLKDGVSIDFIKTLKMLTSKPVVIVITNYPYPQYRSRCLAAGADYFLEKRSDFDHIPNIIHRLSDRD